MPPVKIDRGSLFVNNKVCGRSSWMAEQWKRSKKTSPCSPAVTYGDSCPPMTTSKNDQLCGKWQDALRRLSCTKSNGVIDAQRISKPVINYEEVKAWGESFNRLMQNPVGRGLLKQYLVQEHADEGIRFWEAVESYKQLRGSEEMEEMARTIYDEFISSKAKNEISIDSKCRAALDQNCKNPNKTTFDEAQQHMFKSIETDNYERFKRSKVYMNFLLQQIPHEVVIEWGENFEKLLEYDEGRHLLEEFLINEKAEENLRFWMEVQDYKKCSNKQRKARAIDIYNRFVNPDAKTEISLDGPTKTAIMKNYEKADAKLFEKAEEHIYLLMRNDCYPRFVKAPHYRNFLEMHKKNDENGQNASDMEVEEELH